MKIYTIKKTLTREFNKDICIGINNEQGKSNCFY